MISRIAILSILALVAACISPAFLEAASSSANVAVSAVILPESSLSATNIDLPDSSRGRNSKSAVTRNRTSVSANVRSGSTSPATLTVVASDESGAGLSVPVKATVSNSSGNFFPAGPVTWSKTVGVTVGTGPSGDYAGTFSWALDNSWNYATGTYTATALYTLTSP